MQTPESPQQHTTLTSLGRPPHQRRAVALVLVISFVVLLSALVVAFFSRVTTDLSSSKSYAEGVTARQLADSAIGVVMGQIREATSLENVCWASQPGMIRTYRTAAGQAGPNANAFYKLYSSHDLIVSGRDISSFDPTLTDPTQSAVPVEVPLGTNGWSVQPALFTDLNEPVEIPNPAGGSTSVKRYPIFDPSVAAIYNPGSRPTNPNWKVEGAEVALSLVDRRKNDAPMPVRWIYVLKDGTLTAPTPLTGSATAATGLIASWGTVGASKTKTGVPTKDNPIVGRIAFWTDDDTCKVNINTAGGFLLPNDINEDTATYSKPDFDTANRTEKNPGYYAGSFWDTPRVQTYFDRGKNSQNTAEYRGGLSNSQPAANEFQRYPGHPATTSLGLVFRYLLPSGTGFNSEKLYALTPRIMPGGSLNGNIYLNTTEDLPLVIKTGYDLTTGGQTNGYHLFASVDEMFYSTLNGKRISAVEGINTWVSQNNSDPNVTSDPNFRPQSVMAANSITTRMIDQTRFFLTANSRAPELNLFGRPRVVMWPVPWSNPGTGRESNLQNAGVRNASDDLIRFCATIGRDPNQIKQQTTQQGEFIFSRQDPYSSTVDFSLPRNQKIFAYLRELTSSSKGQVPGFGGSFEAKYSGGPGGRDQILTEIFDYVRTINQKDGSRDRNIDNLYPPNTATNNQLKSSARYAPHAVVVPTRATIAGTPVSGFGRYPTISEATVVFYHAGYTCIPKKGSDLDKKGVIETDPETGDLVNRGGSARSPGAGEGSEVVIYDISKTPGDINPANPSDDNFLKNGLLNRTLQSDWAKTNVEAWTGQLIRAFIIFETFNPMQGYAPVDNFSSISLVNTKQIGSDKKFVRYGYTDPNKGVFVHELIIKNPLSIESAGSGGMKPLEIGKGVPTPPGSPGGALKNAFTLTSGETWAGRNFGGTEGFFHTLRDQFGIQPNATNYYKFQSPCTDPVLDGVRVGVDDKTFNFSGAEMDLYLRYEDQVGHKEQIQKIVLSFPAATNWPMPTPQRRPDTGGFDPRVAGFNTDSAPSQPTTLGTKWGNYTSTKITPPLPSGWAMGYNLPARIAWSRQHSYAPYGPTDSKGNITGDGHHYGNRFLQILQPGDTIRSLVVGGGDPAAADPRIAALQQEVKTFRTNPDYNTSKRRAETLRRADGGFYFDPSSTLYAELPQKNTDPTTGSFIPLNATKYKSGYGPDLVRTTSSGQPFVARRSDGQIADFDTGIGSFPDGAFAGKADEGNVASYWYNEVYGTWNYVEPYFSTWVYDPPLDTYFSPNRQVPGPVMFGSLAAPHVSWDKAGWKTLLFCPNPAGISHPGSVSPPDHLLLDLFSMPVVEPYAISEPFSTAGKVNLNYQLVPFDYIKRTTAIRAALHPLRVTAIPQTFLDGSKQFRYKGQDNTETLRYLVDREQTLKAFDDNYIQYRINRSAGFFKSASQICERYLYPKGTTIDGSNVKFTTGESQIKVFWDRNQLTGDNVREKPYADLYQRITTKSNTFTIHYRVQTLRQRPYSGASSGEAAYYRSFDESRDSVLSELRGNATIERYLDPEDPRFQANYSPAKDRINVETQSLEDAYRFRIISNKRFSPW